MFLQLLKQSVQNYSTNYSQIAISVNLNIFLAILNLPHFKDKTVFSVLREKICQKFLAKAE